MQQDPFCYPMSSSYSQDPRFQNISSYLQSTDVPWSNSNMVSSSAFGNVPVSSPIVHPATPVSTALYGTTSTCSWAHKVPSLMPWAGVENGAAPTDPVVRFTAPFYPPDPCTSQTATSWELFNNLGANKTTVNVHLKRKNDIEVPEAAPQKMCITEERMAARLKALHISNRYLVPGETSRTANSMISSDGTVKSITNLQQLEAMLKDSGDSSDLSKSLILAPELKKLVEPEKLFASTFLDKIERPSMAVVLWQPQNSMIPSGNNNEDENSKTEKKSSKPVPITESNNNFLPSQINTLCRQSLSYDQNSGGSLEVSEEVMDT